MRLDSEFKNDLVVAGGYLWAVFILSLPFLRLISDIDSVKSIWPGIIFFYLAYKHSRKPRGQASISILSVWYFFVSTASLLVGVVGGILNQDFIYLLLLPIAIAHFYLGMWAYSNPGNQKDPYPGLNQKNFDYEVINFDNVKKLVQIVEAGNFDALTSGEYRVEVSDAASQAICEKQLFNTVKKAHLLTTLDDEASTLAHVKELMRSLIAELEDEDMYQIYPLLSEDDACLEYYYSNNRNLQTFISNI